MLEGRTPKFVTAAEITRNFGMWQDRAAQGPVVVTHHGRPRVILLSIEDYEVWEGGAPKAEGDGQDGAAMAVLIDRLGAGFMALDGDMRVRRVNAEAIAHFDLPPERLIGRRLTELYPQLDGSVVLAQLRAVAHGAEESTIELPSELRKGRQMRLRAFRYPEGVAVIFREISSENDERRLRESDIALVQARAAHGGAAVARLSVRATIERVDPEFAAMSGFSVERLIGVRLIDLLALSRRADAAREIESVLINGEARGLDTALLVNGGGEEPARVGIAPLREGVGIRGAIVVLTMAPAPLH